MSMLDLFRLEAESQVQVLNDGLLALEREPAAAVQLEACMRAAHSLKGAARIVGLDAAVSLAHAMEDCLVAAQRGELALRRRHIDLLLKGVDLLQRIANAPQALPAQDEQRRTEVAAFAAALAQAREDGSEDEPAPSAQAPAPMLATGTVPAAPEEVPAARAEIEGGDRVLRVTAQNLNRLLGLTGESLVESRWLKSFADSLLRLKRQQRDLGKSVDQLRQALSDQPLPELAQTAMMETLQRLSGCQQSLAERLVELESFDRRATGLSYQLYDEALACRMRPFADGVQRFPRMVRDLGQSLGKQVRLELVGETTRVDRDILEKLDAPLIHLLRNAVDHAIESPQQRAAAGKPAEGVIRLEARHSAGILQISLSDDGRGVDLERLRETVVRRKLVKAETAAQLAEAELLEFLFLPGFTLKDSVSELSGRGVGLDAVQIAVKQVRGAIRVSTQAGRGTLFDLRLPLTLSVVRTLLAEVGGEPYAFPLAHIVRTVKLQKEQIRQLEGRQHFDFDGRQIGLVTAHQLLQRGEPAPAPGGLPVIVIGGQGGSYGVVADRFLGERELVVQPLDPRLGKIKDIAAGALMEDGAPVLVVDVEDMIRSVEKLIGGGSISRVGPDTAAAGAQRRKRVLVVDDSFTVRELERKLLDHHGYEVEVAVDGMDGWNAVRSGHFNLLLTDVDMPRMDGIELVSLIKKDPGLKSLPVMIVSYKDREEDRQRGLDAGADYYLAKSSFHDDTLLQAVVDLIGEALT